MFAKEGAKLHPRNTTLDRLYKAMTLQTKINAMYLADLTARLGQDIDRDSAGQQQRAHRHGVHVPRDDGVEDQEPCLAAVLPADVQFVADGRRPHVLRRAKLQSGTDLILCYRCGAYTKVAQGIPKQLLDSCTEPTRGLKQQRSRVRRR